MKKLFLTTSLFALSACGGGGPSAGDYKEQKIQELGKCSNVLMSQLLVAEMDFNSFKDYGLSYGGALVKSYVRYLEIQNEFGDISCDAIDQNTGEIVIITRASINRAADAAYSEIRAANSGKCRSSYSYLSPREKSGCSEIALYLKSKSSY